MSHFTVMVVGDDVKAALAPFHEFECTGLDDQYVQVIDETEEFLKDYETETVSRLRGPNGELECPYEDRFFREFTDEERALIGRTLGSGAGHGLVWDSKDWGDGLGYRSKVQYVPEGFERVELPVKEVMTTADYYAYCYSESGLVKPFKEIDLAGPHKYGYALLDANGNVVQVIRRTNPNAKWDWWTIGGRWSGYFRLKAHASLHPGQTVDEVAFWGDVDLETKRSEERLKAVALYDRWTSILRAWGEPRRFEDLEREFGSEEARGRYHAQPAIQAKREDHDLALEDLDDLELGREEYARKRALRATTPFAILKDGVWHERASMGWWGSTSGEKQDWLEIAAGIMAMIKPHERVTLVDCHI